MNYLVRPLATADAGEFRRVRLDALRRHPEAFAASYEDECVLDAAQFAERLAAPGLTRFGAFAGQEMVGLVGLHVASGTKVRHKAYLFSMYVAAGHRGTGIADRLVQAVIDAAREAGALVLQLTVTAGNAPAQLLYTRMGFQVYGIERRALRVGDRFYDEELMALDLDRARSERAAAE
jgi:ribosomal protein S18 acetylase RimI-like enzyme